MCNISKENIFKSLLKDINEDLVNRSIVFMYENTQYYEDINSL